jgi:hypothetical protein
MTLQTRLTSDPLKEDNCVRGYTLSLVMAIQLDDRLAGLLPKGDMLLSARCPHCPIATLLWCKPWQSKRLLSIHFVQSGNCDNLLSSLFICSSNDVSPQHWSVLRAMHTLNNPKIISAGGLSPIHTMHLRGAQDLMWGNRGPFLPAVAMVGYGRVGRCWPLEANVRSTYCRNSKNCLWKYLFYSYVEPIHS